MYALIDQKHSTKLPDSARTMTLRLAWLAMAGIVLQVAALAGNLTNCFNGIVLNHLLNGFMESIDIRAATGLLLTLGLNVWILLGLYRVVKSDLRMFGRFENLALKRPARLLAELGAIWCVLAFSATVIGILWFNSIQPNFKTESALLTSYVGLSLVTPTIELALLFWLALKACRLGREIQQNVPRGTF